MHHRLASDFVRCLVLYVDSEIVTVLSLSLLEKRFIMFGHPEASDPVWLRGRENPITECIYFSVVYFFLSFLCLQGYSRVCFICVCTH